MLTESIIPLVQWERSLLTDVVLLSVEECGRVRDGLYSLRHLWIKRHPVVPFYTLGASNYFDIAYNPKLPYYSMACETNPVLMLEFGWLYDMLAASIETQLGLPVEYPETLALPGFHIFLAHEALRNIQALMHREWFRKKDDPSGFASPIHCDTPHHVVSWAGISDVSLARPFSITLAVSMPKTGAGMYVWDVDLHDTAGMLGKTIFTLLQGRNRSLHEYELGRYCLHSGLHYHQVAPFDEVHPDDVRITLQGHGIMGERSIKLYW